MTRASPQRRQRRLEKPTGESLPVAIGQRFNEQMSKWDLVVVIGGFGTAEQAEQYGKQHFDRLPAP